MVKVLDFGISKRVIPDGSTSALLTGSGSLLGSPPYMAPEQLQSPKDVDARTDIWALGVVLYELVTGILPFAGKTVADLLIKITSGSPAPIRDRRRDAPEDLASVILTCLEKDPARRYQTVADLALALVEFGPPDSSDLVLRARGILEAAGLPGAPENAPAPLALRSTGTLEDSSLGRTLGHATRGRSLAGTVVGALGIAAAIAVGLAVSTRTPGAGHPTITHASASDVPSNSAGAEMGSAAPGRDGASAASVSPVTVAPRAATNQPLAPGYAPATGAAPRATKPATEPPATSRAKIPATEPPAVSTAPRAAGAGQPARPPAPADPLNSLIFK
jgi:serine/threonine-protein kinase